MTDKLLNWAEQIAKTPGAFRLVVFTILNIGLTLVLADWIFKNWFPSFSYFYFLEGSLEDPSIIVINSVLALTNFFICWIFVSSIVVQIPELILTPINWWMRSNLSKNKQWFSNEFLSIFRVFRVATIDKETGNIQPLKNAQKFAEIVWDIKEERDGEEKLDLSETSGAQISGILLGINLMYWFIVPENIFSSDFSILLLLALAFVLIVTIAINIFLSLVWEFLDEFDEFAFYLVTKDIIKKECKRLKVFPRANKEFPLEMVVEEEGVSTNIIIYSPNAVLREKDFIGYSKKNPQNDVRSVFFVREGPTQAALEFAAKKENKITLVQVDNFEIIGRTLAKVFQ